MARSQITRQPEVIATRVAEVLVANRGLGVGPPSPPLSPPPSPLPGRQLVEEVEEVVDENKSVVVVSSREINPSKRVVTHRRTYGYSTALLGSVNLGLSEVEEKGGLSKVSKSNRKSCSPQTCRCL